MNGHADCRGSVPYFRGAGLFWLPLFFLLSLAACAAYPDYGVSGGYDYGYGDYPYTYSYPYYYYDYYNAPSGYYYSPYVAPVVPGPGFRGGHEHFEGGGHEHFEGGGHGGGFIGGGHGGGGHGGGHGGGGHEGGHR